MQASPGRSRRSNDCARPGDRGVFAGPSSVRIAVPVVRSAALVALLGGCGHVPKVTRTTNVAPCDGAAVTAVGRPTWATVADYDRDGDTDLLLLDVHAARHGSTSRASARIASMISVLASA